MKENSRPGITNLLQTLACAGLGGLIIWLMYPTITGTLWLPLMIGALAVSIIAVGSRVLERVQMSTPVALGAIIIAVLVTASISVVFTGLLPLNRTGILIGIAVALILGAAVSVLLGVIRTQDDEAGEVDEEVAGEEEENSEAEPGKDI